MVQPSETDRDTLENLPRPAVPPLLLDEPPLSATTPPQVPPRRYRGVTEVFKVIQGGIAGVIFAVGLLWYGFGVDLLGVFAGGDDNAQPSRPRTQTGYGSSSAPDPAPLSTAASPTPSLVPEGPRLAQNAPQRSVPSDAGDSGNSAAKDRPSEEPVGKAAIPDEEARAEAMELVKEVFKSDYETAKSAEQRLALAQEMLRVAAESEKNAASKYVIYSVARDIAIAAGDAEIALEAVDSAGQLFELDVLSLKAETLQRLAETATARSDLQEIAERIELFLYQAVAADRYDLAAPSAQLAVAAAGRSRDAALIDRLAKRMEEFEQVRTVFLSAQAGWETLEDKPDDPEAHLSIGQYYCFIKRDWETGLPILARGGDSQLTSVAEQDLREPADADIQLQLADRWSEAADDAGSPYAKAAMQARAVAWYQKALEGLTGLARLKAEKRLAELRVETDPPFGSLEAARRASEARTSADPRRRWLSESYNGTFYHISGRRWAQDNNKTPEIERSEYRERTRTPEYIELFDLERRETIRLFSDRMESNKSGKWTWIGRGRWLPNDGAAAPPKNARGASK